MPQSNASASASEQLASTSSEISSRIQQLDTLVGYFKTGTEESAESYQATATGTDDFVPTIVDTIDTNNINESDFVPFK